jgi:hypothetical protein
MAEDTPPVDLMNYEALAQNALRGVVKAALKRVAAENLPGEHHFYISFKTRAPGVSGPPELLSKYPDEMTIVLQKQYWDLAPGETFFSVTLSFGNEHKKLSIPYAAVTCFYDPSVQFRLVFEVSAEPDAVETDPAAPPDGEAPKVVSLDQFRKK